MIADFASRGGVANVVVWWRDASCGVNSVVGPNATPMIPGLLVFRTANLQIGRPALCVSGERDRKDGCGPGEEDRLEHCRWRQEWFLGQRMKIWEGRGDDKSGSGMGTNNARLQGQNV